MSDPTHKPQPVLQASDVTKIYADGNVTAFREANVTILQGEYVAIMGPSGSGKSTLLQLLGTLDVPTRGDVLFQGESLQAAKSLDEIRATKMGFVFQSFFLLPNLTARENVQVPMFELPLAASAHSARAGDLLQTVGMGHRGDHLPSRLSVGERQRVAIARALANDPVVLLADEPTGNLDTQTGAEILDLFDRLHADRGMTLVVVSHEIEVAPRADRLIRLRDGRIESDERT